MEEMIQQCKQEARLLYPNDTQALICQQQNTYYDRMGNPMSKEQHDQANIAGGIFLIALLILCFIVKELKERW